MKQLLLRVDDELHARLAAQARALGKSVNALANEILGLGIDPSNLTRRDRLELKLMVLGEIRGTFEPEPELRPISQADLDSLRDRALASLRGVGPIADELIDYERGER
ncbi:MAG: toxin-antitoxin system HicB family antitoxin [Rhodoglobus sp.]